MGISCIVKGNFSLTSVTLERKEGRKEERKGRRKKRKKKEPEANMTICYSLLIIDGETIGI